MAHYEPKGLRPSTQYSRRRVDPVAAWGWGMALAFSLAFWIVAVAWAVSE